ncbi:MAG TPA: LPS export ABC transporter permease LptF [Burkholderiaceae bacterium]|nr:LPS export ABC transporter permease LptF [Burkholderiaceae bacterium]
MALIFRRAIVQEVANSGGAVFSVLFCIVFTQVLVRLLGEAASGDVDTKALFSIVALSTLTNLPLILALSVFIAVLIALSRAFRDSEMVVWFTTGQSLMAWVRPVLRFAVPIACVVATLAMFVSPWAENMIAQARERFEHRDDVSKVTPGRFIESSASDRVFFVENLDVTNSRVQSVFASQRTGEREVIIVAAHGDIETHTDGSRFLVLSHGRRYEGSPGIAEHRVLEFERYAIRLDTQPEAPLTNTNVRTLPTWELLVDPSPRNLGELLGRIALPVATIVLALLAVPLAYVNPRVGRSANLILATLLALIYLNSIQIMQASVQNGRLGFATAVWLAHAVAVFLLAALFARRVYLRRWLPRWPRPALRTAS